MSGESTDAPIERVTVTYHVSFRVAQQRWFVDITRLDWTAVDASVEAGSLRREFGPFDTPLTVAQWLSAQVYAYTKTQGSVIDGPPAQNPPQGRRLPDSQ